MNKLELFSMTGARRILDFERFDAQLRADVQKSFQSYMSAASSQPLQMSDFKDMQFWSRCYLSSFFTRIDGLMTSLRSATNDLARLKGAHFTLEEQAFLENRRFDTGKGLILDRVWFPGTEEAIRRSPKLFLSLFGTDFSFDHSGLGWQSFVRALEARNCTLHPQGYEDLDLTDGPMTDATQANRWFAENIAGLIRVATASLGKHLPSN